MSGQTFLDRRRYRNFHFSLAVRALFSRLTALAIHDSVGGTGYLREYAELSGDVRVAGSKALSALIALDSIVMAIGHIPLIRVITSPFPMAFLIGLYFLVSTIIYLLGAVLACIGRLFKLTNYGLIAMAVIDELLLIYTREMPNVIFRHMVHWSTGWFPLGTVQIFVGQLILIVLCAIQLRSK